MNKLLLTILVLFFSGSCLFGQSYLGKQRSLQISWDEAVKLSKASDPDKMAGYFYDMSFSDVLNKTKSAGIDPQTEEGTIYIDGKLFRMDMTTRGQSMTAILNLETREVLSIMHDEKQYFVMNLDDVKAMKENMAAQMENMKGMMDNLPPEAKAMMEKMTGKKDAAPPKVEYTGKSKTINGFQCEEVLVIKENEREQLWITLEHPDLRQAFYEMTSALPVTDEDTKAQWEMIKKGWPAQSISISGQEGYMDGSFSIHEISSLEKATHKPGIFDPPSGYTKKTMQDMMGGMPGQY